MIGRVPRIVPGKNATYLLLEETSFKQTMMEKQEQLLTSNLEYNSQQYSSRNIVLQKTNEDAGKVFAHQFNMSGGGSTPELEAPGLLE